MRAWFYFLGIKESIFPFLKSLKIFNKLTSFSKSIAIYSFMHCSSYLPFCWSHMQYWSFGVSSSAPGSSSASNSFIYLYKEFKVSFSRIANQFWFMLNFSLAKSYSSISFFSKSSRYSKKFKMSVLGIMIVEFLYLIYK